MLRCTVVGVTDAWDEAASAGPVVKNTLRRLVT